jgi:hypothetical protein
MIHLNELTTGKIVIILISVVVFFVLLKILKTFFTEIRKNWNLIDEDICI